MERGRLVYLVGASGAGKDSLIRYARDRLPAAAPVVFAQRYITRAADPEGENHVALSEAQFDDRLRRGRFAMVWHEHGFSYGIGIEIEDWLAHGRDVVVNGSRGYLAQAADDFPTLVPVLVSAAPETLEHRLRGRAREVGTALRRRLELAARRDALVRHPRLVCIDNDGELAVAGERLLQLLVGERVCS